MHPISLSAAQVKTTCVKATQARACVVRFFAADASSLLTFLLKVSSETKTSAFATDRQADNIVCPTKMEENNGAARGRRKEDPKDPKQVQQLARDRGGGKEETNEPSSVLSSLFQLTTKTR